MSAAGLTAFALGSVALIFLVDDPYYARIVTLVFFWAIAGASWNIIGGFAGQFSVGHAGFVGIGAYTVALTIKYWNLTPWIGLLLGAVVAMAAAALIGIPTLRLRGTYFVLATLVFPLIFLGVAQYFEWHEVTLPIRYDAATTFMQFRDTRWYSAMFLGVLVICLGVASWLDNSMTGRSIRAIRNDERAAESIGIATARLKLAAFAGSAGFAAMAGGIYIQLIFVVTPDSVFGISVSVQSVVVALAGGLATVWGPVLGAAILIPVDEWLRATLTDFPGASTMFYGVLLMILVIAAPDGLIGRGRHLVGVATRRAGSRAAKSEVDTTNAPDAAIADDTAASASVQHLRGVLGPVPEGDGPVLVVKDVRHRYGGVAALQGIDLEVSAGEFVAIIGPNGAGKTTFFDAVSGVIEADSGDISVIGQHVVGMPAHQIARRGLRRTFQMARLFSDLSVRDNIALGALHSDDPIDVDALANALGLEGVLEHRASALTPSVVRLVELARAMAGKPRLLLLDEPLAGLDWSESEMLLRAVKEAASTGMAIVMIEHALAIVKDHVERIVVMDEGAIIAAGEPQAVLADERVVSAYLGGRVARPQR